MTATDTSAARPQVQSLVTDACDGVALTLPDGRRVELQFNRTGTVGGTITIAGAERALATTVQPQSGILLK